MTAKELPPYIYECVKCEESDGFEAKCREIPDLRAYGETPDEAFREIEAAVCAWLEVLQKDRMPFPVPANPLPANGFQATEESHVKASTP